jgi:hypothetical protein
MNTDKQLLVSDAMKLPFDDAELVLLNRLGELGASFDDDALAALDGLVDLMAQINVEIIKCQAPAILEYGHLRAAEFTQSGKAEDMPKQMARATASLHRTQESLAKLGAARVRTQEAIRNRERDTLPAATGAATDTISAHRRSVELDCR